MVHDSGPAGAWRHRKMIGYTQKSLGALFGVSGGAVKLVVNGNNWKEPEGTVDGR